MAEDFSGVPTARLVTKLEGIEDELFSLAEEKKAIHVELLARHRPEIQQAFDRAGKDHGKVSFKSVSGFEFEAEVRQTVKWNSDKLVAVCKSGLVDPSEQARVFEMELYVSESVFKNLPDGEFKRLIQEARTTRLSEPSIKVKKEK